MMPEAVDSELLFFDTFSHENTEELNLDLVQFPRPVLIHEVRVVPLGTRIQADVPGGIRLGATNPTAFKLDLFVNNLTKPNAATFEKLGVLDYKGNENIQLPLDDTVATDGLIIKGWYSAITLAVYGCPTTVTKDRASPPPPPPPRSKTQVSLPVVENIQPQPVAAAPVAVASNKTPTDWDVRPSTNPPAEFNPTVPPPVAPSPAPVTQQPPQQPAQPVDLYQHDIDERFQQAASIQTPAAPVAERNPPVVKEAPQVELDEHGEAKFPKEGNYESDELFAAYLREKDKKREEEKREKAERERERAERERLRRDSRSLSSDRGHSRGHSRGHTRSNSRSRSRSAERDYRHNSREREREYRESGSGREYREFKDSDRQEKRERDRYTERTRDRGDSRESREREKDRQDTKDRQDSRDRDRHRSTSPERGTLTANATRRDREKERRDSGEKARSPDRTNKSPRSRTPRRSRSRTPRASRSRSRERTYDRDRGRDSYKDRERSDRDKDYERDRRDNKDREREKLDRDSKNKDYDREYRNDRSRDDRRDDRRDRDGRESRDYDRDRGENKDREMGWSGGRGEGGGRDRGRDGGESDKWEKGRDGMQGGGGGGNRGEWERQQRETTGQPPDNRQSWQQQQQQPPQGQEIQTTWGNRDQPRAIETVGTGGGGTVGGGADVWSRPANYEQPAGWPVDNQGRMNQMEGTWAPPPQASQQPPPQQLQPQQPPHAPPQQMYPIMPDQAMQGDLCGDTNQPYDPLPEMEEMYTPLSDGEIEEEPAYSDISSDENFLDSLNEEDLQKKLAEWQSMDGIEDPWNYAISSFNPYQCDLSPLETFQDPSLTEYEIEKSKLEGKDLPVMPDEAQHILRTLEKYRDQPHHEEWIEVVESIIPKFPVGLSYLLNKMDKTDVLETLVTFTLEGLDLSRAMQQPVTAYKVRHLKLGIRLAGALCACDAQVAGKLLEADVQHKLLDLYEEQYMSSSVKLHIVKALDSTVRLQQGMDCFLGKCPSQQQPGSTANSTTVPDSSTSNMRETSDSSVTVRDSPYQRYLRNMTKKQISRLVTACTALLNKVHFYEVLNKLTAIVEVMQDKYEQWLAENTTFPDAKPAASASSEQTLDDENAMETEIEPEMPLIPENMTVEDIEELISCVYEIIKDMVNADFLLGQPAKTLPTQCVFEVTKSPFDPRPSLFHLCTSTRLLEAIFVLLASPASFSHNGIFGAAKDLLTCLISSQQGLLYLCSQHGTVNGIIRALTQTPGYIEEDEEGTSRGPHPAHMLGLEMIYYLQTLQSIDRLRDYHLKENSQKDLDDAEPLGLLHSLYLMTFTPQGREAVVHVFTMGDNLQALLPFTELTGDDALDVKIKRSVCHSYTVLLLLLIVRHSQDVAYLQRYGQKLLLFSEQEPASNKTYDKVTELQDWLSPLKKVPVFGYDTVIIGELVKLVKTYSEEMTDLPKGLVTTLRILRFLCLEPDNVIESVPKNEGPKEIKFMYALIELFSADAMPMFQKIIQSISELLTRPLQQTLPKMGMSRTVIQYTVKPVLQLLKRTLSHLIHNRGAGFRDLTMLPCVFSLHTVMCSVSHSGTLSSEAQDIQNAIVDILMTYTQPGLQEKQTEEALEKSLWTQMMRELLKYVLTAPFTFLSGLIFTSELLPLPLPIQTKEPLTDDEVQIALNQRKLWSAHLHPLAGEIREILRDLSGSACQPLQQLLRRVCWQLADLAVPSALMVVRCLLDTVGDNMDASIEALMTPEVKSLPPEERPQTEEASSSETAKILNLLAFLMNQPPVKAAFIYLTGGKSRQGIDEQLGKMLVRLARLLNVVSEKATHVQAQESIVSIFQSLCDLEVTMVPAENNMSFVEQLANSLPSREQMAVVCEALLLHVDQRYHSFSSILPALRTLALLMLHDYGFFHVKMALDNVPRAFYNLFQQINNTFSKDSSDCIATLSSAIELLQFLVALPEAPDGEEQTVPFERTYLISYRDLRAVLKWNRDPDAGHPLSDLDNLLHAYAKEEETLKAVYESVNLVVSILKSDEDQPKPDMQEPTLPEPESLQTQFGLRSIYLTTDDEDDRLSATYWLATPMGEDTEEQETVSCDFQELSHKYCGQDFDLVMEIQKGAVRSEPPVIKRRRSRMGRGIDSKINTSKMKGKSVAPMRGRGYGRVMPINKNDMFRSRPQNTSRPPSMHVDDFIKMELQGGQTQIGPTGMNPHLNKYREQIEHNQPTRGRGGGFQRGGHPGRGRGGSGGGPPRGRFMSPPGYGGRRDMNATNNPWGGGGGNVGGGFGAAHGSSPTGRGGGQMYRGGGGAGGSMRGSATGGMNMRGSPPKPPPAPWANRPPRQDNFQQRGFNRGSGSGEWGQRSEGRGGRGFGGGRGGRGAWRGREDRRFMPPPGTPPFYDRRDGRHQRSFTK